MRVVVSESVKAFAAEDAGAIDRIFPAVKSRGKVFVATPRHMDAVNMAFDGMTHQQRRRVSNRIADGKEDILFGWTNADGSDWSPQEEFQKARMIMYGFD